MINYLAKPITGIILPFEVHRFCMRTSYGGSDSGRLACCSEISKIIQKNVVEKKISFFLEKKYVEKSRYK